jgi:hypothetical protein
MLATVTSRTAKLRSVVFTDSEAVQTCDGTRQIKRIYDDNLSRRFDHVPERFVHKHAAVLAELWRGG